MKSIKKSQWLFLIYAIGCHLPYFIPALNQIEPKLAGIPFTLWSIEIWLFLCCGLLFFFSRNVWDSYDEEGDCL